MSNQKSAAATSSVQDIHHEAPYVAEFESSGRTVVYIAAAHGSDIRNKTMSLIRTAFVNHDLKAVLIEGRPWALGISPRSILDDAKQSLNGNLTSGEEPAYAAILASSKGIPFRAGEPDDAEVLRLARLQGFTEIDLVGFYVVREFQYLLRSKGIEFNDRESALKHALTGACSSFGLRTCFDILQIKTWYLDGDGKTLGSDVDKFETAAVTDGNFRTQRIGVIVNRIRDEYITARIQELASQYRTILVVYGSFHFTEELTPT